MSSIAACLRDWSLNVNQDKTEWITINAKFDNWKSSKQLGSLMGEHEDIRRRIELASRAYGRMYSLWLRRNNVSESRRLRLNNAIVLPTLLYNCETWGPPKALLDRLDSFHRYQLWSLLGIWYPQIISNADRYGRTKSMPVSKIIDTRRLRMTGHILRMDKDTPPQIAMKSYFNPSQNAPRGCPRLTSATALSSQLSDYRLKFKTAQHLEHCRVLAANKVEWNNLVKK